MKQRTLNTIGLYNALGILRIKEIWLREKEKKT